MYLYDNIITISKDDVNGNLLSGGWNLDESFLRIYKLPESSSFIKEVLDGCGIVRLSGDSHGIVYF